jgi:DNA-binding LacI/PurR family transcriptional regulator
MLKITERILKNGHRKVVFLGSPEHSSTGQLRKRAFTRYASERGIEYSVYDNISSENDAYLNSMRAFHEEEGFTAMVCWNDTIAAGAMEFFLKNKISIPNDMALSGFGNLDFSARLSSPLTTVEQNFPEMGSRAVELLIKKIKKPGLQGELIKVETELIIRESL